MRPKIIKIATLVLFVGLISTFVFYKSYKGSQAEKQNQMQASSEPINSFTDDFTSVNHQLNSPFDSADAQRLTNSIANVERIENLEEVDLEAPAIPDWTDESYRAASSKTLTLFSADDIFSPPIHEPGLTLNPPPSLLGDSLGFKFDTLSNKK